jgi:hypothetical protein
MVDALELLHAVLAPHGVLADLRPDRSANPPRHARHPQVYCVEGDQRVHAGYLKTLKPFADYRAADLAVRRVIRRGLFALQAVETFDFHYYFDSPAHLEKAVATRWTDTVLEASTNHHLRVMLRKHPKAHIMAVSRIRLSIMRRQ